VYDFERMSAGWRKAKRVSVALGAVFFVAAAGIIPIGMSGVAAASTPSSMVISKTLPGFVAAAPGAFAGPGMFTGSVTAVNESELFRGNSLETSTEQFLVNHQAVAYSRAWSHQRPNGGAVQIVALSFHNQTSPANVVKALSILDQRSDGISGTQFSVHGISGALGQSVSAHYVTSVPQYQVVFSKGDTLFLVLVAQTGGLTKSDAVRVATMQFRAAR
jgi:hypothetical protein